MNIPRQTLELLIAVGEGFDARDFDTLLPLLDPHAEFHEPPEQPGAAVFRGHDEIRDGITRWAETWVEQSSEAQGVEVLPDGRVLAFTREYLTGRDGLRVENDCASLFTLRDGRVLRWQLFWDPANARAAAGVSG